MWLALLNVAVLAALVFVAKALRAPRHALPHFRGANVLLVTIDTLRADHVGCYGYGPRVSPRLDGLAAQGIRFEQVVAPAPLTLPSHVSLMSAMDPPSHGVRDNGAFPIAGGARMLAEVRAPPGGVLTGEERRKLRSLGYVSAPAATMPHGPLADPKDKIETYRRFNQALQRLNQGNLAEAAEELQRIVAEEPGLVVAQLTLGEARLGLKDYDGAAKAFQAALALHPDYSLALAGLGLARLGLGDRSGARRRLEALLAKEPDNVSALLNLGQMDLEEQKLQSARRRFESALARHDGVAALHFGLGVAVLQLGDVERAARALERAAQLAPEYPQVHTTTWRWWPRRATIPSEPFESIGWS